MAEDEWARLFEQGLAAYSNPLGAVVSGALSAVGAMRALDDEPPSAYPFTVATGFPPGTTGAEINRACLAQPPIRFPWVQKAGDPIRYAVRPRSPYDAGVCIRTNPPDAERMRDASGALQDIVDVTLADAAATLWNRVHVHFPKVLALQIPAAAPAARLPAFFGGGSFDIASGLLELQASLRGLTTDEIYRRELGVAQLPAQGYDDVAQSYEYRSRDGSLRTISIGTWDLARELAALRACEAQPTGCAGTAGTVNCFQSLLSSAGGPTLLDRAKEEQPFGTIALDPRIAQAVEVLDQVGYQRTDAAVGVVLGELARQPVLADQLSLAPQQITLTSPMPEVEMSLVGGNFGGSTLGDLLGLSSDGWGSANDGPVFGDATGGGGGGGSGGLFGDWVDSIPVVGPLLGNILETVTSPEGLAIATRLAQAGVIGGTVGSLLAPAAAAPAAGGGLSSGGGANMAVNLAAIAQALAMAQGNGADVASTDDNDFDITDINNIPLEALQALQRNLFGTNTASVPDASNLFRARPGGSYLPSRIQVKGPDGSVYVLANLGRAIHGSREKSVLKRLAKDHGFKCSRYGTGVRRRSYRRRRPR